MAEQLQNILAFWTPGPIELIVILVIAVLLFGRRLPEIARGLGKSLTEFKKGVKEAQNGVEDVVDDVTNAVDSAVEESTKETEDNSA